MDTRGEIVDFQSRGSWTSATGDATLAYRGWDKYAKTWNPLLKSALRTVAYNRGERVLVIYDYAVSDRARAFELNFNALAPFSASGKTARVEYDGAAGCIRIYGTAGAFEASSGFVVQPELKRPQQFQARFTAEPAKEFSAVTVVREDCRDVDVAVQKVGTSFSVSVAGSAPIILDRSTTALP
jgi:hypothetical protein